MSTTAVATRRAPRHLVLIGSVAGAWGAVLALQASGHRSALRHDALVEGSLPLVVALLLFVAAWQLMVVAMMLPSATPMIRLFATAASRHPQPANAQLAFVAGYATVWTAFGTAAFLGDAALHRAVDATPWLDARPWLVAGTLLTVAGAAQLLPLTTACLHSCRHPFAYLLHHFRPGPRAAYRVGLGHGVYCLGCCWGLMLVMFAAGVADIAWMAGLTAVMAYEKVGRHGEAVVRPVGAVLSVCGVLVVLHAGWLPHVLTGANG